MNTRTAFAAIILGALASPTIAATETKCLVSEVASFANRTHVACKYSNGETWYFAVPASNAAEAARLIELGQSAAKSASKTLWITYEPYDHQGMAYGCDPLNCRRPISLALKY